MTKFEVTRWGHGPVSGRHPGHDFVYLLPLRRRLLLLEGYVTKGDAPLMRYIAAASGPSTVVAGGFAANKLLAESGHQPWKGGDVDVFVYNATYLNDTQHLDAASLWLFPRQEKAVAFATHFFQTLGYHVEESFDVHGLRYPDGDDTHSLVWNPHVATGLTFSREEVAPLGGTPLREVKPTPPGPLLSVRRRSRGRSPSGCRTTSRASAARARSRTFPTA